MKNFEVFEEGKEEVTWTLGKSLRVPYIKIGLFLHADP